MCLLLTQTTTALSQCYLGYDQANTPIKEDRYFSTHINQRISATLQPQIVAWMNDHNWQQAYALWQRSVYCESGLEPCNISNAPPQSMACDNKNSSYNFLLMHRHFLLSVKSLWPDIEDQFAPWDTFPEQEDYPEFLQNKIRAWPNEVIRSAKLIDRIMMMNEGELLERWPSEQDFAHWIVCGSDSHGLARDALYPALINNAVSFNDPASTRTKHNLEYYFFWKAHAWMDRALDKYRMAIGKTPYEADFQANVIQQCQLMEHWLKLAASQPSSNLRSNQGPIFKDGAINPQKSGLPMELLGEVTAVKTYPNGTALIKIDPQRVSVPYIWVASPLPLAPDTVRLGERYLFIGYIRESKQLAITMRETIKQPTLLIVQSIQSPK